MQLLVEAGLEINQQDECGKTLLMYAVYTDVIEFLLAKGADVNTQDKNGGYALFNAVSKEEYEVAELLLNNGADIYLRTCDNKSASSILQTKNSAVS